MKAQDKDKTIYLPEQSAAIFQVYLDWLYAKKPKSPQILMQPEVYRSWVFPKGEDPGQAHLLFSFWTMGDYLQDETFKERAIEELLDDPKIYGDVLPLLPIVRVLHMTRPGSGLQKWLLDHLAVFATEEMLDTLRDSLSADDIHSLLLRRIALSTPMVPNGPQGHRKSEYRDGIAH